MSHPEFPERLDRYKILDLLGRGSMGEVFLAIDPKFDRRVALKVMSVHRLGIEDQFDDLRQRFVHEALAAGRLNHPGIVTLFDAGTDRDTGRPFIVMEWVEGESLRTLLRSSGPMSVDKSVKLAAQVAKALDYAHRQGVVHRDIKPANLLIRHDDRFPKIADFGVAKLVTSSLTLTGQILGSPNYMSPEQVQSEPVDGRADLFSLGCVLYEMLSGRPPFAAESLGGITYKVVNVDPRPIRIYNPDVPDELVTALHRMLAKEPIRRFADGNALAEALELCLEPTTIHGSTGFAGSRSAMVIAPGQGSSAVLASGTGQTGAPSPGTREQTLPAGHPDAARDQPLSSQTLPSQALPGQSPAADNEYGSPASLWSSIRRLAPAAALITLLIAGLMVFGFWNRLNPESDPRPLVASQGLTSPNEATPPTEGAGSHHPSGQEATSPGGDGTADPDLDSPTSEVLPSEDGSLIDRSLVDEALEDKASEDKASQLQSSESEPPVKSADVGLESPSISIDESAPSSENSDDPLASAGSGTESTSSGEGGALGTAPSQVADQDTGGADQYIGGVNGPAVESPPADPPAKPARITVNLKHRLRKAHISFWVDGQKVASRRFSGGNLMRRWAGQTFQFDIEVPAGKRKLEAHVSSLTGNLEAPGRLVDEIEAGARLNLDIQVQRQKLSLAWRTKKP